MEEQYMYTKSGFYKKHNKLIKGYILILTGVFMTLFSSGCFLYPREQEVLAPPLKEPPEITYKVMEPERGTIIKSITCTGYMVPVRRVNVFFKHSIGRLKSINVMAGDIVEKGDVLAELETEDLNRSIKLKEIALRKAEINYMQKKAQEADQYTMIKTRLDLKTLKEDLEELKDRIHLSKLTAPITGQIDYVNDSYSMGDNIPSYRNLFRIVDMNKLRLEYQGENSYEFKLGMNVEVNISDTVYNGVVVTTPSNMPVELATKIKETVFINVEELPEDVEAGEAALITLVQYKKDDVLKLPKELVKTYGARKYVPVLVDGEKIEKTVETGIETATEIEILNGLEEKDKVIMH